MHGILPIPWWRLALSVLALALLLVIGQRMRLGITKAALVSSARGTVQLLALGYVLSTLLAVKRPELVLAMLLVMLGVAARTGAERLGSAIPGLSWLAGGAIALGTAFGTVFMTAIVVKPTPWYDPQYVIPFAGMLLGNSMNGASLAGERFLSDLRQEADEVEARLCLGLSGEESVHPVLARALRAALIPTLNSFAVAGVVQLPGMMTGQILSGTPPLVAVRYQILIFVLLVTCTALSTLTFLVTLRSRALSPAHQLRREVLVTSVGRSGRGQGRQGSGRGRWR